MVKLPKNLPERGPILTTDAIILNSKGEILLTKRNIPPYKGYWVLPGGHVDYGELVEEAAIREVKEETGLNVKIKKLCGVYSDPKRDPRYHTVGVIFLVKVVSGKLKINNEVKEINFFPLNKLPKKIGADHRQIIKDFIKI